MSVYFTTDGVKWRKATRYRLWQLRRRKKIMWIKFFEKITAPTSQKAAQSNKDKTEE